ncbi:hypothetical protein EIP91_001160 [Steccherinum ochraceum]|uniref:Uncharacterized protein n=1 Tax=Steccherinum ochraceum TaxID=92696 RepID=A0A4R0RUJ5_9APHY|nr:hypothetical protein EIP91_001160 [Steccherinum ochraceum]
MEAPKPVMTHSKQPEAVQMSIVNPPARQPQQVKEPKKGLVARLRGGGAAKDCFLGACECFLCFEVCKDCCECFADIICCPCEMCC